MKREEEERFRQRRLNVLALAIQEALGGSARRRKKEKKKTSALARKNVFKLVTVKRRRRGKAH